MSQTVLLHRLIFSNSEIKVKYGWISGPRRWGETRKRVAQRTVLVREQRSFRLSPIFAVDYATTQCVVIKVEHI
ncbi:hypothetical protein M3180_08600 [Paenibacillus camelliae]|nr:hypothetical protein [Paenibacillus camelliae]